MIAELKAAANGGEWRDGNFHGLLTSRSAEDGEASVVRCSELTFSDQLLVALGRAGVDVG